MKIASVKETARGDLQIEAVRPALVFLGLALRREQRRTYRGSCTVWHEYPSGRRCTSGEEWALAQAWQRHQWEKGEG